MKLEFNPATFVNRLGARLVDDFADASVAGTPGLVGSAREHPARKQLEKLMPAFIKVGSGIVMDSFGERGNQQDVVLYERDFCPVFSINDTPEATYFPIEGVVAVGEIKSTMDKATIIDALSKIKETKKLKRFSEKTNSGIGMFANYRPFGTNNQFAAVAENEYNQTRNANDQVFGFILCKNFRNSGDSVIENIVDFGRVEGFENIPNFVVSLENGFIQNIDLARMALQTSALTADAVAFCPEVERAFTVLVNELKRHSRDGRSVPLYALDRYMQSGAGPLPDSRIRSFR